jgi:hypothetical protein
MGFRPYARKPFAPVDIRGNPLKAVVLAQGESDEGSEAVDEVAPAEAEVDTELGCDRRWGATIFVAAIEAAAKGKSLWLHERERGTSDALEPCLRTQRRWVAWAGRLLGLVKDLGARPAEQVACALAVPGLIHQQAREVFGGSGNIRMRAVSVLSVLCLVAVDAQTVSRLLEAGTITGAFGPAFVWSPERGRREFPARRTVDLSRQRGPPEKSHEISSPAP